jgi:hypothetical protein
MIGVLSFSVKDGVRRSKIPLNGFGCSLAVAVLPQHMITVLKFIQQSLFSAVLCKGNVV